MNINMTGWPIEQLEEIIKLANEEITNRQQRQRIKLIENFHQAFIALRDHGIDIAYTTDYGSEEFYLEHWEQFEFN